jgi:shikimate dehydrogenase
MPLSGGRTVLNLAVEEEERELSLRNVPSQERNDDMKPGRNAELIGLLGSPVKHSLSPLIQNRAFDEFGLNMFYVSFDVKREDLADAVRGIRALGMRGLNVTHPLKEAIVPHLDQLTKTAAAVNAVNTVSMSSGKLVGHNTDVSGLILALRLFASFSAGTGRAAVLGSGGAARATVFALLHEGARDVRILARNAAVAARMVDEMSSDFPAAALGSDHLYSDSEKVGEILKGADLIVNATPVGMSGSAGDSPLPQEALPEAPCLVVDLVYHPVKTALLESAEKVGLSTLSGLPLLVCQASLSLEIWSGKRFDEVRMMNWLEESARQREEA